MSEATRLWLALAAAMTLVLVIWWPRRRTESRDPDRETGRGDVGVDATKSGPVVDDPADGGTLRPEG